MKLDHVAVAVRDLDAAVRRFQDLGLCLDRIEEVPEEKTKVAFFGLQGTHLELIAPLEPDSVVQRSLDKRGEGLHHLCLEVAAIEDTMAVLKAAGFSLLSEKPGTGAGGRRIVFIHPRSTAGVLIELVEKPGDG